MPSRVWKEQDSNLRIPFPPSFRLLTHYIFTDRARRLIKDIVVVIDVIYNYFPLFLSRSAIIASAMLYASFASKNLSILLIDITLPNRFFLTLILFNIDSLLHQYLHRFQCDMVSCYITFHVLYKFFIPFDFFINQISNNTHQPFFFYDYSKVKYYDSLYQYLYKHPSMLNGVFLKFHFYPIEVLLYLAI